MKVDTFEALMTKYDASFMKVHTFTEPNYRQCMKQDTRILWEYHPYELLTEVQISEGFFAERLIFLSKTTRYSSCDVEILTHS